MQTPSLHRRHDLGRHASRAAAAAAELIIHGRYARQFWSAAVGLSALTLALAVTGWNGGATAEVVAAGLLAQASLLAYESIFVRAGQDIPLS